MNTAVDDAITGDGSPEGERTAPRVSIHLCRVSFGIHCHRGYNLYDTSPKIGRYQTSPIRLGSRGDSYYEYLL